MTPIPVPIPRIHIIGDEIGADETLDNKFGDEGDIVVNKQSAVIDRKISGVWTQIYPAVIL